jgi:hypothetical protein
MYGKRALAGLVVLCWTCSSAAAQQLARQQALDAMRKAAEFYHHQVSSHGGYVYHYSLDLSQRWGEGIATADQIWVQPPGTPTVGLAYLQAYQASGDRFYLDAAVAAALSLVYGQLKSGGWTNMIDFDPDSDQAGLYRNGRGRGKNNSSLDDGQTQSAIRLLIQVDEALQQQNLEIHRAAEIALQALLDAQFPNGGFPQVWTGPVEDRPIVKASYPGDDWRTEGRVKNYWDMYTLNDNVTGYVADTLIDAHRIYADPRYLAALQKLGDFLLLAQMPEPQPGWAQQYNVAMQPIWARKFEPPAVSGDETQEVIETLMKISAVTNDRKYLQPIPSAAEWLRRSLLPGNQLARYYELKTNRPLFMTRQGEQYTLTYDDSDLPSHYGWKTDSRLSTLGKQYAQLTSDRPPEPLPSPSAAEAKQVIEALDVQGRWVSTYDGQPLVGQPKLAVGTKYLSSQVFSDHLALLSRWIAPPDR